MIGRFEVIKNRSAVVRERTNRGCLKPVICDGGSLGNGLRYTLRSHHISVLGPDRRSWNRTLHRARRAGKIFVSSVNDSYSYSNRCTVYGCNENFV